MSLEDKVKDGESEGLMKKAFRLGFNAAAAAATTALSLATVGTFGVFVGGALAAGGAIAAAYQGKSVYSIVSNSLKTYATLNAIVWPVLSVWDYSIPLIHAAFGTGLAGVAASTLYAIGPFNAYFEAMSRGANHLIKNYLNPSGIINSIKDNFYNSLVRSSSIFAIPYGLAANGYPNIASFGSGLAGFSAIPTLAPAAAAFGLINGLYPVKQKAHSSSGHAAPAHAGAH